MRARTVTGSRPKRKEAMKLVPNSPPGRSTRKARAFAMEIAQLHEQGYTFEAIRAALAEVGVHVSKSTVQREVARGAQGHPPKSELDNCASADQPPSPALLPAAPETLPSPTLSPSEPRSGKDIAQAFVQGRITNSLFRARSRDEDSRH